jgi:hypothetical protein
MFRAVGLAESAGGRAVTYARFDIADVLRTVAIDAARLHESTSPESIADAQQAAVVAAFCAGCATAADISGAVVLPAEVVRRRLAEVGITSA